MPKRRTDAVCLRCKEVKPTIDYSKHYGKPDNTILLCAECRLWVREEAKRILAAGTK